MSTPLLTSSTASTFPVELSDGFARPLLGWAAFRPEHFADTCSNCMTSNVWIGESIALRAFMEAMAIHYNEIKSSVEDDGYNDVVLGYWEKDGLAMAGEFCMGDAFFEQGTQELYDMSEAFNFVLADGNDNDPGQILLNYVVGEPLDVATRLTLAHFMTRAAAYTLTEDARVDPFTDGEKKKLKIILERKGA